MDDSRVVVDDRLDDSREVVEVLRYVGIGGQPLRARLRVRRRRLTRRRPGARLLHKAGGQK